MASDNLTKILVTATTAGDLTLIKSHFPALPPASPILKAIALEATKSDHPEILTWALSQGFRLPPQSLNNEFYHAICDTQSIPMFRALIDSGVDLNAHTSEYYGCETALVSACVHGNVELARFLLENGQDPNAEASLEAVVYVVAGERRKLEMVELLLKFGLKLAGMGTGAAIAAAEKDEVVVLRVLLDGGCGLEEKECWWMSKRDERDLEGTALYRACRAGAVRAVEFLIERGADMHWKDELGRDCLGVAREEGRDEVVRLLMEKGVVKEPIVVERRVSRMVDEANWAWRGEMPDVFCVD